MDISILILNFENIDLILHELRLLLREINPWSEKLVRVCIIVHIVELIPATEVLDTVSFMEKFKAANDGLVPNQFAADGYDCVYAVYNALTAAKMDGTASAQDMCAALVEWFTTNAGFDGLTGKGMTWDENGMISKAPAAVVITDGIYVPMA